jgi:hypothetical protein
MMTLDDLLHEVRPGAAAPLPYKNISVRSLAGIPSGTRSISLL